MVDRECFQTALMRCESGELSSLWTMNALSVMYCVHSTYMEYCVGHVMVLLFGVCCMRLG